MAREILLKKIAHIEDIAAQFFTPQERKKVERLLGVINTYALLIKILIATLESPLHSIHGYQLIQEFPAQVGENVPPSTIYNLLKKFLTLGLIEQVESTSHHENPNRKKYKISDKGNVALQLSTAQKELFLSYINEAFQAM
jgi:DNA-binding PadR family transcriptional regulator